MFCPKCGATNRDDAYFCGRCGNGFAGLLRAGTLLAQRYRVRAVLGQGGFGAVYHAADAHIPQKTWAVKELRESKPEDQAEVQALFESEARLLSSLDHPGLPAVVDYFMAGSKQYLVMEFVEGDTLLDLLVRSPGPVAEAQVVSWACQLCSILEYLHGQPRPIIHRDIKPENIKQTPDGAVKLLDFGLARTFKGGRSHDTVKSVGTLGYVSPEQALAIGESGVRSDIYSLGATLYCLLSRHHPADNPVPFEFPRLRRLNKRVSAQTEFIVMQALRIDPAERWQSAAAMRAALEHILGAPAWAPSQR